MTIWMPDLSHRVGPRYQAIADAIADAIANGELPAGARLPPQRDLAWKLGVTVGTVSRAYMLAENKGLLSGEVGRGTYVRDIKSPARGASIGELFPFADDGVINLSVNSILAVAAGNALRETLLDLSEARPIERLLRYMPASGHPSHRAAGAKWIAKTGLEVSPNQIILTEGAMQGISVVFAAMAEPGEPLLCEALTYPGMIDAARHFRLKLEGVAMDGEGMIPSSLDECAKRTRARFVFVMPTVQNPTSAIMGPERRAEIVAVARANDLTIIEDDVYGFLPAGRPAPLSAMAPERSIYLASASKCLGPGLRVGWMACPPVLVERMIDAVHALGLAQPQLTHEIVRRWIESGTAEDITESVRSEMMVRQRIAADILQGLQVSSNPASFHVFLNLPEPWRREEFASAALAQGVRIVPASAFAVGRVSAPHAVRISLAAAENQAKLVKALGVIASLCAGSASTRRDVI